MLKISKSDGEIIEVNPDLILFDKDGTLIDIHHYWSSMLRLRTTKIVDKWFGKNRMYKSIERELLDAMGVDLVLEKIKITGPVGIKPREFIVEVASNIVRLNGVNIRNIEIEKIFQEVDINTSKDMNQLLKLLPGVLSLLNNLKMMEVSMVLVSNDITSRARLAMESLKIDHFFKEIIGGDEVQNTKPSPDLAFLVAKKTGNSLDSMMVIGDNPVDIEMGISANINLNIAVLTGLSDIKSFSNLNCMIINNLESIGVE